MWPVILAQELIAARRAITIARYANAASTTIKIFSEHSGEDVISATDQKLDHMSIKDDEIYFYMITMGLYTMLSENSDRVGLHPEKVCQLADLALSSPNYVLSAPDALSQATAFASCLSTVIALHDKEVIHDVRRAMTNLQNTGTITNLIKAYAADNNNYAVLKPYLMQLSYDEGDIIALHKMVGDLQTAKLSRYYNNLSHGLLSMTECLLSWVNKALISDPTAYNMVYFGDKDGSIGFNFSILPYTARTNMKSNRRITSMNAPMTNAHVQMEVDKQMANQGYIKDGSKWQDLGVSPSTNVENDALSDSLELFLMGAGLDKMRVFTRVNNIANLRNNKLASIASSTVGKIIKNKVI